MKVTIERVKDSKAPAQYVVLANGLAVGLLEKYRDTRTDKHPWKAFRGVGHKCQFLQAFYPQDGGKGAAVARVLDAGKNDAALGAIFNPALYAVWQLECLREDAKSCGRPDQAAALQSIIDARLASAK